MRMSRPGAPVVSGLLTVLLAGSLGACGNNADSASYDEFCTSYVKVFQAEINQPMSVADVKTKIAALRKTGVPSDMSSAAQAGLDEYLKTLDAMTTGTKKAPTAPDSANGHALGGYLDAHCASTLKSALPPRFTAPPQPAG